MQLDNWMVSDGYFNTAGHWIATDDSVRRAIHSSLGAVPHADRPPAGPPTRFVQLGDPAAVPAPAHLILDDGSELSVRNRLPPDLPLGAHKLSPDDAGSTTNLFVVPARQRGPARGWGWAAQLYASRSSTSWGHGDLGDLADLGSWAKGHGADLVAHNPMGSSIPLPNQQPSPYFGSSRRFLSVLYLRIEDVTGAELLGPDLDGLARVGRELNRVRLIDRDKVFALKMAALEQIWAKVRPDPRVRELLDADTVGFAGLKAAGSRGLGSEGSGSVGGANDSTALSRHSLYCVLAETYGTGWSSWPPQFRHPDSPAVDGFHRKHSERVDFWRWVHLELDRQHVRAAKAGAGLMADLAVGFDPDGSDAWVDQDMLALDCRIGAPGDDFNPDGQDWGVTPYIPWKLRNAGYEPWLRTMRSSLNNCSALRIDHVMGLFRLFWLPLTLDSPGSGSGDGGRAKGAYVYQYGAELLDLALMEAAKAGVWLAGEDLGTVEDEVRTAMTSRGVLGYRVGWFEDSEPPDWPATTVGSLNTHDLATVAGVWDTGHGTAGRDATGPLEDNDQLLLARLKKLAGADSSTAADVEDVILGAHESLAAAGSAMVLVSLDDAQAVVEQPNHPGTIDEFPNWRLALPVLIEELDSTLAPRIAGLMSTQGRSHAERSAKDSDSLTRG